MEAGLVMMSKANEAVKARLESALNNVKYSRLVFNKEASFKSDGPIWLLGKLYHGSKESSSMRDVQIANYHDFIVDFTSRIWFTYRDGFTALPDFNNMKSDCGWGCMLRSGQMILAQALVLHLLGRDWSMFRTQQPTERYWHNRILWLFNDVPASPFSIHCFVRAARTMGKGSGDWFGPASTAYIIKKIFAELSCDSSLATSELSTLAVYVASDCTVCIEEVEALCCSSEVSHESSSNGSVDCFPFLQNNNGSTADCGTRSRTKVTTGRTVPRIYPVLRESPGRTLADANCSCSPDRVDSWVDIDKGDCCEMSMLETPVADSTRSVLDDFENLYCHEETDTEGEDEFHVLENDLPTEANGSNTCHRAPLNTNLQIFGSEFLDFTTASFSGQWLKSAVIFIPLRLGGEHLNPVYIDSLKNLLSLDYCLGIIGGKPKRSMYFIGYHDDKLLYLDPHFCQDVSKQNSDGMLQTKTFHCTWPKLIAFKDLDPSCAIGFYIRNRQQLMRFKHDIETLVHNQNRKAPLFTVVNRKDFSPMPSSTSDFASYTPSTCRNGFVFL